MAGEPFDRDNAPHFTPDQIMYLEKWAATQPTVYTPSTVDGTVKLLGIIGERKGAQDLIAHLRSLQRTNG